MYKFDYTHTHTVIEQAVSRLHYFCQIIDEDLYPASFQIIYDAIC